jgi:hypothetical protein
MTIDEVVIWLIVAVITVLFAWCVYVALFVPTDEHHEGKSHD